MASARYEIAIHSPHAGPLYLGAAGAATGGAELQVWMLARYLSKLGHRVCHIVHDPGGLPKSFEGVDIVVEPPRDESRNRIHTITRMTGVLKAADAAVYIQRSAGMPTGVVGAFANVHKRAFIYSCSSDADLSFDAPVGRLELMSFKFGLRMANRVVAQTETQRKVGRERGIEAVTIPSFCQPNSNSEGRGEFFLWVGRPATYKNPAAYVHLAHAIPEARFVMVGVRPGDFSPEVGAVAAATPNLSLRGPMSRDAVLSMYEHAVAVVNTSDFEGLPNSLLEGWARGVPALTLNIDPDGVIVGHGLGSVAHGSMEVLVDHARSFWQTREQGDARRGRVRAYVEQIHAPPVVAAHWSSLIEELLRQGSRNDCGRSRSSSEM